MQGLRLQAERASTIESAQIAIQQARSKIDQAIKLGIVDISLGRLKQDVDNFGTRLTELEDSLGRAEDSYSRRRGWPSEAWAISKEVRERFPTDPRVLELIDKLSGYKASQIGLRVIAILGLISNPLVWIQLGLFPI